MPQKRHHLRSEAVQDILTKVPHWMILWGNTIILIMLILFFVLSWFIRYPDAIASNVLVTTQIPPQKESAKITGRLDTLLVNDNQKVGPNQILAVFENSARLEDVLYLERIMNESVIQKDSFYFPIDQKSMLLLGEINGSYALFESDYMNYMLNKSLEPYTNTISAGKFSSSEIQFRIANLEHQKELDKKALEFSRNTLERNKELYEKGVIALQEFEKQEFNYLKEERSYRNLDVMLSQLKQSLGDTYRSTRETQINSEMEAVRLYNNALQSYLKLKESIDAWYLKYVLTSKMEGSVSFMGVWNKNQTVQQGDLMFTIIPSQQGSYIAKIKAPVQNSGKIKVGQKAQIRLHNFPASEYGMLTGIVQNISAIPNNEGNYLVDVSLSKKLTTSFNVQIPFTSEMSGTAEIITEDLRLLERLFYQLRGMFS